MKSDIRNKVFAFIAGLGATIFCVPGLFAERKIDPISHFNHEFHIQSVFNPQKIACQHCHNFKLDSKTKRVVPEPDFEKSALKRDFKSICHDCHVSKEAKNQLAPQACSTCHQGVEAFRAIKPQNHTNVSWSKTHATNARVDGDSCMQCHVTSQCAQCHLRRNDIQMNNHTRNFRFTHSIEARAQPQTCDSCHSKTYCIDCHWGKK